LVGIVVAAVALKFVPNDPAGTVMVAGTVNNELLLDSEIAIPPAGAAIFSVAMHVELCPPVRLPTVQVIEEWAAGTATVPPVVLNAGSAEPVAPTPTPFVRLIGVVVALAASVTWILATTPADIALEFEPVARQVNKPGAEVHDSVFPAAAAAGPVVAPIAEIWLLGYARVHSNPAAAGPPTAKDRARFAVVPGPAVPDANPRLETCANADPQRTDPQR